MKHTVQAWLWRFVVTVAVLGTAGCAGLPQDPPGAVRAESHALAASPTTALGAVAAQALAKAEAQGGHSGFRALPEADFAFDARLELLRRAQASIDVQTYLIGSDATGRAVLRELRDAGRRGVRVRLLIDDAYTIGLDPLLLGLAAVPNVEVRLYNPFTSGRGSALGRAFNVAGDFQRLNHRMHNKLLVADGAFAIVGGRNLADEYFLQHAQANFLDFDVLAVGPLVAELSQLFDDYWNSRVVRPVQSVARSDAAPADLCDAFERHLAAHDDPRAGPPEADRVGQPALGRDLEQGLPRLLWAPASAYADPPEKTAAAPDAAPAANTVMGRTIATLSNATTEAVLVSPYLIPGPAGVAHMAEARRRGVTVRIITNSMASTDEPLVASAYQRYRRPMLEAGVELYELSSAKLKTDRNMRRSLGASKGSLHAKLAFIDRRTVLLGSMNLDPRSAWTNTELGVRIDSAELAEQMDGLQTLVATRGAYRVTLAADGSGLRWSSVGDAGSEDTTTTTITTTTTTPLDDEPEVGWAARLKAKLLSFFVPERLL